MEKGGEEGESGAPRFSLFVKSVEVRFCLQRKKKVFAARPPSHRSSLDSEARFSVSPQGFCAKRPLSESLAADLPDQALRRTPWGTPTERPSTRKDRSGSRVFQFVQIDFDFAKVLKIEKGVESGCFSVPGRSRAIFPLSVGRQHAGMRPPPAFFDHRCGRAVGTLSSENVH